MGQSNTIATTNPLWRTITYALLFIIAAAKLGIMLWSTNKGFDLGDEGLYMLSLSDPEHYKVLAHGYFLNKVLPIKEFTIPISRTISIGLELAGGLVLSWGVYRWLTNRISGTSFWAIWALVLMGSFQSILARCVSYNDLINFFGLASAGVLLASLSYNNGRKQSLLWVLSAFLLTFCTIFKAPVTISLSVLFFAVITFYGEGKKLHNLGKALGAWVAGAALTIIAYTILYGGFGWMDIIAQVKATADLLNYRPIDLVLMYVIYDGLPNLLFVGAGIGVFAFCSYAGKLIAPHYPTPIFIVAASITTALGIWAISAFKILLVPEEQDIYPYLWMAMGVVLYLLFQLYRETKKTQQKGMMPIAYFLLALPVAMIGGTNGFITETLPTFFMPWFGFVAVALVCLKKANLSFAKHSIIIALLAMVTSLQFIESKLSNPFGLPSEGTIFAQKIPLPGKDGLLVDKMTFEYLGHYRAIMQQHHVGANTPILAMNYMPGLVYLAGGYSPSAPFYIYHPDFNEYNCFFIHQTAAMATRPVIMYRTSIQPEVMACLKDAGFGFPENYTASVPILDPYAQVYENAGATDQQLYIYFPN